MRGGSPIGVLASDHRHHHDPDKRRWVRGDMAHHGPDDRRGAGPGAVGVRPPEADARGLPRGPSARCGTAIRGD